MRNLDNIVKFEREVAGLEYFKQNKVKNLKKIGPNLYEAQCYGSQKEPYKVILDNEHLLKSTCTCPHCKDHQKRFCKHKVAVYYELHRDEAKQFHDELVKRKQELEQILDEYEQKLIVKEKDIKQHVQHTIDSMSEDEVRKALFNVYYNMEYDSICHTQESYDTYEDYSRNNEIAEYEEEYESIYAFIDEDFHH